MWGACLFRYPRWWMRLAVLLAIASSACLVDLDFSGTSFLCSDQVCPEGLECRGDVCVDPQGSRDGGPDGSVDAAVDAVVIDAAPVVCPDACSKVAAAELCFCGANLSWDAARADCEANGLSLPRIGNSALSTAARDEAVAQGIDTGVWVGGTDAATEGEWRWITNDELFWIGLADGVAPAGVFTDFATDEPNQFMGNDEDCLNIFPTGWNDGQCQQMRPYFCGGP